jgi:hypothetical protein
MADEIEKAQGEAARHAGGPLTWDDRKYVTGDAASGVPYVLIGR